MKHIVTAVFLLCSLVAVAQVENKIPRYTFNNQLGVGRTGNNDTAAYLQIGPSSGGDRGIILPRVAGIGSLIGTAKKALLVYNDSKDSLAYYNGSEWIYLGGGSNSQGGTYTETTGYYAVQDSVNTIICEYTGGDTGIDLPTAASSLKRELTIRNVGGNTVNFNYLLKYSTTTFSSELSNGSSIRIKSDGTWWNIVQDGGPSSITGSGSTIEGDIF